MWTWLAAVLPGFFFVAACSGGSNDRAQKSLFEFGNVVEGERIRHIFELKNNTDVELAINEMAASCGCTAVKPSSRTLAPHSTIEFAVELDTRGKSGRTSAKVLVALSDNSTREFNLSGYVYNKVLPPLDFKSVTNSESVVRSFDLNWPVKSEFAIAEIIYDRELFDVRTEDHSREKTSTISVSLVPGVPYGVFNSVVEIRTNSPEQPSYTLSVMGYVEHPIEIISDRLAAGMLDPGRTTVLTAEFKAPYGGVLTVKNAKYVTGISGAWRFLGERDDIYLLEFELIPPESPEEKVAIATLQVEASVGEYTRTFEIEGMGIVTRTTPVAEKTP
ncbi:MAG: DUF1573 domain-containing protein [Candidatus Hydrogenedentes bacterium]|nr:DUF1573 domain-containing protein [Candidatus Hydrogenedentota bacterium]